MSTLQKELNDLANEETSSDVLNLKLNNKNHKNNLSNNLEMLDIEMENCCAILELIRIANENTDDGINNANAEAADGVRSFINLLREKYVTPSINIVLEKGPNE